MADRKGKEEYHLPEEENAESQFENEIDFSEQKQKSSFSAKQVLQNKKVWVPALLILVIYGIYKFMEFRDKQQLKVQKEEVVTQTKTRNTTETVPSPLPRLAGNTESPVANNNLQLIEQANKAQAQMEVFGSQLNQLQQAQIQLNQELNEVTQAVKALTMKIEQAPKIEALAPLEKKVVKKRIKKYYRLPPKPVPRYHIRAVVPGRAWIESINGRLFTVRIGESIAGYGIIEEIDVARGVIITSSGREITYGRYDS